jgi:hypothetical protein
LGTPPWDAILNRFFVRKNFERNAFLETRHKIAASCQNAIFESAEKSGVKDGILQKAA